MRKLLILLVASLVFVSHANAADVAISALPAASAIGATDVAPVVQGAATKKATAAQIATYTRSVTTKTDVGLSNVDNTSDATKNAAVATLTNKTLTTPAISSPTGLVKADVGLGNVDNTSDATKNAASVTLTNKTLTAPAISSPTGLVAADVGLGNVDNTSDVTKNAASVTLTNKTITAPIVTLPSNTSAEPRSYFNESDVGADLKLWDWDLNSGVYCLRTRTDADGAGQNAWCVTRGTTTALTNMTFGYSVAGTYTFPFTGTATFSGSISVPSTLLVSSGSSLVTGSTAPAVGTYRPGTNRLGFASNSSLRGEFDSGGQFIVSTVGKGISITEGSNAKMGTCTLVAGTCTVSTTAVTANSRIMITAQTLGTVAIASGYGVSARTAGTSFVITASAATDTSVIAWILFEPN